MERKKTKKFLMFSSICLCLLLSICSVCAVTFGKYAGNTDNSVLQTAENFYFERNLLQSTTANLTATSNKAVSVEIRNFKDSLNYTPSDLTFTIATTNATVSGGNPQNSVYTLTGGSPQTLSLTFTPTASTFTVSATSTAPYSKTISANFDISEIISSYSISQVDAVNNILQIDLSIGYSLPTVTINWDSAQFDFDSTNPLMQNAVKELEPSTNASAVLFNLTVGTSYTIMFFPKVDGTTVAVPNTEITNSVTITLSLVTN